MLNKNQSNFCVFRFGSNLCVLWLFNPALVQSRFSWWRRRRRRRRLPIRLKTCSYSRTSCPHRLPALKAHEGDEGEGDEGDEGRDGEGDAGEGDEWAGHEGAALQRMHDQVRFWNVMHMRLS